jgi:two-component system, OmpR family, alkaline phosphatase synthesis response regulator PhoP
LTQTDPTAAATLGASSAPAAVTESAQQAQTKGCSILVVDDNEQNRELLVAYLEELACEVRTAGDGFQALDAVKSKRPDIVLLDVMMPRMSGYQACQKMRADKANAAMPIVMVTALNEVGDMERAVESGADDFLTKPVNKVELLTRVRSLLRVSVLQKQLMRTEEELKRLGGD